MKKHLTPIGKAGKIVKNVGKGATEQHLPGAAAGGYSSNLNNYAQATPMANPTAGPTLSQPGPGLPDTSGFP
jgi:hypothetical protein